AGLGGVTIVAGGGGVAGGRSSRCAGVGGAGGPGSGSRGSGARGAGPGAFPLVPPPPPRRPLQVRGAPPPSGTTATTGAIQPTFRLGGAVRAVAFAVLSVVCGGRTGTNGPCIGI